MTDTVAPIKAVSKPLSRETLEAAQTTFAEESKPSALKVLFPEPEEVKARIPLITRLGGRAPDMRLLIRANAEYEFRRAIAEDRDPDWKVINPIEKLLDMSVSLGGGKGRAEAVAIAKTEPMIQGGGGFWSSLFGGRKRRMD